MAFILLPYGGGQVFHPLSGNVEPGAAMLIEVDELDEVLSAKRRCQPIAVLAFSPGDDRLIHQVITKDSGTFSAAGGDDTPETGLHFPTFLLGEFVIPGRDIGLVVTAQARQ